MSDDLDDGELAALAADQARAIAVGVAHRLRPAAATRSAAPVMRKPMRSIVALLTQHRPDDAVLSAEQPSAASRLQHCRVWIVDPLDGTREYGEPGARTDWAVHVALCVDGVPAACAVAPAGLLKQLWRSDRVQAFAGCLCRSAAHRGQPHAATAGCRGAGPAAGRAQLLRIGSAGAKAIAVLRGDAELYVHTGGA